MANKDINIMILRDAIDAFEKTTKFKAYVMDDMVQNTPPYLNDIALHIAMNNEDIFLKGTIEKNIAQVKYAAVVYQTRLLQDKNQILITRYVTPKMADTLRDMDIQFIDTAGNVFINNPPVYIFIKGNRLHEKRYLERPVRALQPTGLKVLFALLCNPGIENAPMRKIAEKANVALGTVDWVIKDLKKMAFIIDMGKRGRRLVNKKKLLERWVITYPEALRPKQLRGRYRAKRLDWWEMAELEKYNAYWGGETAAAKLTNYLKPKIATVYVGPKTARLIIDHRIKKDPEGDIELRNTFWNFEFNWAHSDLVHPILIYADLLATGDPRNIETAGIIYDRELIRFIRED
jgi:hypothetical protein